jgi:ParB-like nuclease domain
MRLATAKIVIDDALYPRNQADWMTVYRYQEAMEAGASFPPPVVGVRKKAYILLDGRHRLLAYRRRKTEIIQVIVSRVPPEEFFLESVRLNAANGRPLSTQERIAAAARLRHQGYGVPQISQALFMPVDTLERLMVERLIDKPTVKNPQGFTRKAAARGNGVRNEQEQHALATRNAPDALRQVIAILEHRWFDLADEETRRLLVRLQELAAALRIPAAAQTA